MLYYLRGLENKRAEICDRDVIVLKHIGKNYMVRSKHISHVTRRNGVRVGSLYGSLM